MHDPLADEGEHWIAWSDFMTTMAGLFLVCVVLMVGFINTPTKSETEANIMSPGQVIVETMWEPGVDVDLWVQAPGDVVVGYSNKAGRVFNLLRDDLGYDYEKVGNVHFENAFTRGIPPGEYVVNVHMFRNDIKEWPIKVNVGVSVNKSPKDTKSDTKSLMKTEVLLEKVGQEVTAARFRINGDGEIVPGSVTNKFKPLRARQ